MDLLELQLHIIRVLDLNKPLTLSINILWSFHISHYLCYEPEISEIMWGGFYVGILQFSLNDKI